jgi:hypothetical protein
MGAGFGPKGRRAGGVFLENGEVVPATAPQQQRHGRANGDENDDAHQRLESEARQGVGDEQGEGEDQEPEASARRHAGEGIAFWRQVAAGPADEDEEHRENQKAADQLCQSGHAQQGNGEADQQHTDQEPRGKARQGIEQQAWLARNDAVGAKQGERQCGAGRGNEGDQYPQLVERKPGRTIGNCCGVGDAHAGSGWSVAGFAGWHVSHPFTALIPTHRPSPSGLTRGLSTCCTRM